jgi:Mg-chelatase subunit ChlI
MNRYPFSAIVGQPDLKLALLLASVDWRLSVLLRGDKARARVRQPARWRIFFRPGRRS